MWKRNSWRKYFTIVGLLILTSCQPKGPEENIVGISAGHLGSGVIVNNKIYSAKHVFEKLKAEKDIKVKTECGDIIKVKNLKLSKINDLATLDIVDPKYWKDLRTGSLTGIRKICAIGYIDGNIDKLTAKCGIGFEKPFGVGYVSIGGVVVEGMSGGGCFVDDVLIGVISYRRYITINPNKSHEPGSSFCTDLVM